MKFSGVILLAAYLAFCVCPSVEPESGTEQVGEVNQQSNGEKNDPADETPSKFSHKDQAMLINAFGVSEALKIMDMLENGALTPIDLQYQLSDISKIKAIESICASNKFQHPLIIRIAPKLVKNNKIGNCDIRFSQLSFTYSSLYPTAVLNFDGEPLFDFSAMNEVKKGLISENLEKVSVSSNDLNDQWDAFQAAVPKLRALEVDVKSAEMKDFEKLFVFLKSPANKLKRFAFYHNILQFKQKLSQDIYDGLEEAFKSENFKPDELGLFGIPYHEQVKLITAVRHKIKSIDLDVMPGLNTPGFAEVFAPDSTITNLELVHDYTEWYRDDGSNGEALSKALTSKDNKITQLIIDMKVPVKLKYITKILQSPNNKLIRLDIPSFDYLNVSVDEWKQFIEALKSENCKLKYLTIGGFLPYFTNKRSLDEIKNIFIDSKDLKIRQF